MQLARAFIKTYAEFYFAKRTEVCVRGKMGCIRLRKFISFAAITNWQVNTIQPACEVVHPQNLEEREKCVVTQNKEHYVLFLSSRNHVTVKVSPL